MKILFATNHGYLPQRVGGAESSTHELILALRERSHECAVLGQLQGNGWLGLRNGVAMRLLDRRVLSDRALGYRVHRSWDPGRAVAPVLARERPDLAVIQAGAPIALAARFVEQGLSTMVYLRDVAFHELGADPRDLPQVGYFANSRFVADSFRTRYAIGAEVIPPLFRAARYRTQRRASRHVTFINPDPIKGAEVAFAVAQLCPEIDFLFVRGWPMSQKEDAVLVARVAGHSNITLLQRRHDMRRVYRRTKVLLVPSQCEEAWGRVATEAQFSGIPVVASNRGGLPEAVGPGGVVLSADASPERWAAAVRSLYRDREHYEAKSAAALEHAARPQLDPAQQITAFEAAVRTYLARSEAATVRPDPARVPA